MAIVVKRPLAELDLIDIWDYIAEDSYERADEFLDYRGRWRRDFARTN